MTSENKDPMSDQDAIARRAHELFVQRGGVHGYDQDDWLRAEAEMRTQPLANASSEGQSPAGAASDTGESNPRDASA